MFSKKPLKDFPKWLYHFISLPAMDDGPNFSTPLGILTVVRLFYSSHVICFYELTCEILIDTPETGAGIIIP